MYWWAGLYLESMVYMYMYLWRVYWRLNKRFGSKTWQHGFLSLVSWCLGWRRRRCPLKIKKKYRKLITLIIMVWVFHKFTYPTSSPLIYRYIFNINNTNSLRDQLPVGLLAQTVEKSTAVALQRSFVLILFKPEFSLDLNWISQLLIKVVCICITVNDVTLNHYQWYLFPHLQHMIFEFIYYNYSLI